MHCHCGTNNRAPRWTFTDPCKPEVRPGAREESASPAWLAAPALNARDTTKVYIWRLDTGCGLSLYRKCHSHNTPGKKHNNTSTYKRILNFDDPILIAYSITCTEISKKQYIVTNVCTEASSEIKKNTKNIQWIF